jgi:hypothetical protein
MVSSIRSGWLVSQGEAKCCAPIDRALGPDFTVMPPNHALDGGQPNTGAAKLAGIVQSLEGGK